ncbi:MAG: hypothetical protein R6V59_01650 [Dehalococcoidia bacterium]
MSRSPVAEVARAATRPIVTIIFAGVIAAVVIEGIDAPHWFIGLATACISWWFIDRTRQHMKEKREEK